MFGKLPPAVNIFLTLKKDRDLAGANFQGVALWRLKVIQSSCLKVPYPVITSCIA
jgi:hypothetical protein